LNKHTEVKTIKIDPNQEITSISVKECYMPDVMEDGEEHYCMCGIRMTNADFETFVDEEWMKDDNPDGFKTRWTQIDVPVNQIIVGIQCGYQEEWISRLGFRMATMHSVEHTKVPEFIPTEITGELSWGFTRFGYNASWENLKAFKKPSKLIGIRYKH
jgi:hypothetical protein